jgi:(4-(4-[2-(gamma-L-glutamylamino)ethyl]phenoxymethyl)furan-2-yl)methanamine synthase
MILGLDIGGANTKAASSDGSLAESIYMPLWKNAPLIEVLERYAELEPEAVAVVITGELADCFSSKSEGIKSISTAVRKAFHCPVHFWGVGGFGSKELAGANWSASAALLAREVGDSLFVDMGSTTTDIIPIIGEPVAAHTDLQRLARGELVYMGMLRTNLGALLPSARIYGRSVPLSPELFAIAADIRLVLGEITAEGYTCDTPDGAEKNRDAALRRLARTVCADLDEIGERGALAIARQVRERQHNILLDALLRQTKKHNISRAVAAGIGEGIILEAASFLGMECILLSEKYGRKISEIFPAYAAAWLLAASSP